MTTKKANKLLVKMVTRLGFEYVGAATHGDKYRHPVNTWVDPKDGIEKPQIVNVGGTPSDPNFHRQTVRKLKAFGYDVDYLNG